MFRPWSIQPLTTRGQVCPTRSAPAVALPQQRVAQIFCTCPDRTLVQYSTVHCFGDKQFPSPTFTINHSKSNHWNYRAFITNQSTNNVDKDDPPVTNIESNKNETISKDSQTRGQVCPTRSAPAVALPQQRVAQIFCTCPDRTLVQYSTVHCFGDKQFPSPTFTINHSKSNHWNYRAFITNQSTNNVDKDDPPVTNIESNKNETISKDSQTRGEVSPIHSAPAVATPQQRFAEMFSADYDSSNSKPIDFLTVNDKPPYSISAMIGMAISTSPRGQSTIRDIYNYISNVFPYYERNKRGWKNSVRHWLKKLECFKQVSPTGGGVCWTIDTNSNVNFMKGSFKKAQKISNVTIKKRSIRKSNKSKHLTGDAENLNIRKIPNSNFEIYELVPPDSRLVKGASIIIL